MRPINPIDFATFDIRALSQAERTAFYRDAISRAQAARAKAIDDLFRALAKRLRRHPLLVRALVDSTAVLATAIALGATMSEPVSARMVSVPIGHIGSGLPLLW